MQNYCFHIHTLRCGHADDNMNDATIAKLFYEAGFKTIAFTDHNPWKTFLDDKKPGHAMRWDQREDYLNSVKSLAREYKDKMDIYTGYEMEYIPSFPDEMKQLYQDSEMLVIGQHFTRDCEGNYISLHKKDYVPNDYELDFYAQCLEDACREGFANILAHPDLYMIHQDEFSKKDKELAHRICETAIKYDVPIEINLCMVSKNRFFIPCEMTYPRREFWEIASEYKNIRALIGLDFHGHFNPNHFDSLAQEVINCLGSGTISKIHLCSTDELTDRFRKYC